MTRDALTHATIEPERYELAAGPRYRFDTDRRTFLKLFGAGIVITVGGAPALAQDRGRRRGSRRPDAPLAARLHIGEDGLITVMTGKVEVGQGARAELTLAAAEELDVSPDRVTMMMADTALTPDDGGTYGSQTTPRTVPTVRRAAAAARQLLVNIAAARWNVGAGAVTVENGVIEHKSSGRSVSYAELAGDPDLEAAFAAAAPADVELTRVEAWDVMGRTLPRPGLRDIVTGRHRYPSDIVRADMLYGKVLRPPSFNARLASIDLAPAQAMEGVVVVHDGDFVGCAAPTSWLAGRAVKALARTATWEQQSQPSSDDLFAHLKDHAQEGDVPSHVQQALDGAARRLAATYEIAYIQHAPMEPRAAVAEWDGDRVTVWTGSQVPTRVHSELCRAFNLADDKARVVIPDTGGGFGGKHTGETAVEAARLARAARRPVSLRWTRTEEFTWAYFRPAGVIELEAGLDGDGRLAAYHCININSGGSGIETPYLVPEHEEQYVRSDPPLRQGSYRGLAATANHFARESFMDELAIAAGTDPLDFRLAHLAPGRLRDVLEVATERFGWSGRAAKRADGVGFGLACGTEKGSVVAACAEVAVNRERGEITVRRVTEVFECGPVINPQNLQAQVEGAIIQGLGGALSEAITFKDGRVTNATFTRYQVPRFGDVPAMDIALLNRPDLDPAGAGETPIVAIAPAIGNAIHDACGIRLRSMPMRGEDLRGSG